MINQSLRLVYRHAPITTPSSGDAAARRKTITTGGISSGKVWVQSSITVWVKFGGSDVDATAADNATEEMELVAGGPVPVLDTGGAAYISIKAASDARVVITEVT